MKKSLILLTAVGGAVFLAACAGGAATPAPKAPPPTEAKSAVKTEDKSETKTEPKAAASPSKATGEPIKIGALCDRSGPTANVTPFLCDAVIDWMEVANNVQGGAKGRPFQVIEIDVKYEVPLAVDAYKKLTTRDGVAQMIPFGTPLIDALAPSANNDRIVIWSPGFGLSDAADGKKFPNVFPGVATYHSQAMALMKYIGDEWKSKGNTSPPKVIYLYWDNPAGQDPLQLIKTKSAGLGLEVIDTIGVPATTVDMTTIMTQVKDKNPDYVLAHVFAKQPVLMLQAAEKIGFPANKIVGFVWALEEDTVKLVGPSAEGFRGLQFTSHFSDEPEAYQILDRYWRDAGKQPNARSRASVFYTRGLAIGNFMVEAARMANNPMDGPSLKQGIETGLRDFRAHGLLGGTSITPEDHGGSRKVRMYVAKSGKLASVGEWFEGPPAE
jgi:branched-chain amino acid transport system substrate-binding protein